MKRKYSAGNARAGFLFTVPWIIGTVFFFLIPMVQSFWYSVSSYDPTGSPKFTFKGFEEYRRFFLEDSLFISTLFETIGGVLLSCVMVIFFSLFIANVLVQNFKGQKIFRTVFFLPFIVATGIVISVIKGDVYARDISSTAQSTQFQITVLRNILLSINLNAQTVQTITDLLNSLFEISWKCGLQILIFMSGLRSVSPSIKEAAKMEGATGWEYFWKVAMPMISPLVQLNIIYTVIDSFTDYSNVIIKRIYGLSNDIDLAGSTALATIYFGFVFLIILIAFALTRKKIFYYNR